ncbi:threonine-phosphate decarboxylase [Parasphingorhabdus sp.]|uniref:threonine-phosphate decarboxylase n=1 Tax=Parasphingorhabdus sp. TaxID=2709688 RepID=UPI003265F77C
MNLGPAADPFRFHGGRLAAAAAHFHDAPTPWVDLSTGISPLAYPIADVDPSLWCRLPEPEQLGELEAAAAHAFGVNNPAEIVAVPGSDIAIRLLGTLFSSQCSAMLTPIYSGHRAAWPDAAEISLAQADDHDLLILANPNNPDGRVIATERLRQVQAQLIVDEAFADSDPATSLLPDRGDAIVLRSFGKFFGLAGLRLGFVIADISVVRRLRALLGDWPISGMTIAVGLAAYRDQQWQQDHRQRLQTWATRLDQLLRDNDLDVVGGTSLFRLAAHDNARDLFEYLGKSGILVRPFEANSQQLRFGLPKDETAWDRLSIALNNWRENR